MAHEKAIAQAFDGLWGKSLERNWILGRLGLPGGFPVFDVPDKPGYKYVNKGIEGEEGRVIALDRVGVADILNQRVRMRYEFGEYVIREAEYLEAGSGGVTTLLALTDVSDTPTDGDTLEWDTGTGTAIWVAPAGGAGGAPSPHDLSGIHHSGTLDWTDINFAGSDLADLSNRAHASLSGVTANQHHDQVHVLATGTALGADHSISGATAGDVLRALSATTAAFDVLQHNDLGGVTANQHHNQIHSITGSDHTIAGSQFQLVGATGTNTLGLLTPSSGPGAAAAILRTDSNGGIALDTTLFVVAANTDLVTIDTNLFYADGPNNRIGINRTPGSAALDVLAAANADHTLRVKQKSGQTGRLWRVEDTAGNELIVLDSQGDLQSGMPGFVSGLTGWQITPTGTAEFNNVFVRGELHATVFVKDEVHAVGGTLLVATAGKMHSDADIDATSSDTEDLEIVSTAGGWTGTTLAITSTAVGWTGTVLEITAVLNYIEIDDPPSGPGLYFFDGDVIRSKAEIDTGVTDQWFTVRDGHQLSGYSRYSVTKESGTDEVIPAGSAMVSWGQVGDGRILMTSDLNHAPYLDVFSVGPSPWTGAAGSTIPHVRLGQLEGVGVTAVSGISQYGMIAGTDLSDANSAYAVFSNLQVSLYKVDLTLNDGSNDTGSITADGNLTFGTNIGALATTSFQVISSGANAGDVIIGREAGNYLKWDQSAASLTVNGTLTVGGSGVATTTYVDSGDSTTLSSAASDATTKANAAIAAAEAFSQGRRVVGVSGTWTSTDADTITWTSVSVRLGDGTTKTITNGNTGNMGGRSYLYVDSTATAPLTLSVTTSLSSLGANNALIAVADPGADFASVSIVAGSTYISGDNIITGSVTANQIKALTITASQIAANTITAAKIAANTITASQIAAGTITATEMAAAFFVSAGGYRTLAVNGTFSSTDADTVAWTSLQVVKADGTIVSINNSNTGNMSARTYLFISATASGTVSLSGTTSLSSLPANAILLAVCEPGAVKAGVTVVGGGTLISGDQIVTGSIVATKISVSDLNSLSVNTGALSVTGTITVGTSGQIFSTGKTDYADVTAGFFLGWDTSAYKFDVGDANNFLRWDGSNLGISTNQSIEVTNTSTGQILTMRGPSSSTGLLTLDASSVLQSSGTFNAPLITGTKVTVTSHTFQIAVNRTPASATATGVTGEICWDLSYLYVCIGTNTWRRIPVNVGGTYWP